MAEISVAFDELIFEFISTSEQWDTVFEKAVRDVVWMTRFWLVLMASWLYLGCD